MIVTFNQPKSFLTKGGEDPPWHQRLGHPGNQILKSLGFTNFSEQPCDVCAKGKMTTLPFKGHFTEVAEPLDCLHLDVVGPITPTSKSGYCYFLTMVDQHTSFKITKFLKNKSDVFNEFVIQQKLLENLHDRKIKKIVTDGGGEFVNQRFKDLANTCGFTHIVAPPYTPEYNGFAERANRTILDKARCLLLNSNIPNQYWAEAVNTATFLTNIIPTPSRNNYSTHYLWLKVPPKIRKIRTFGCKVVFAIPKQKRTWKLGPVGEIGILLGFENEAYRILKISDKKVYSSRHVVFFEKEFPSLSDNKKSDLSFSYPSWDDWSESHEDQFVVCLESLGKEENESTHEVIDDKTEVEERNMEDESNSDEDLSPARKRIKVIGPRHPTLINSEIREENILPYPRRPVALNTQNDPLSYNQAVNSPYSHLWVKAIKKELQSMWDLKVWEEIPIQDTFKLIGTTWVFKTKTDDQHRVVEYKAQLCAQGFSQTQGADFSKTFAPTGRLNSLRTLISFAVSKNLLFEQLDIKSAFLNAPLEEEVYLTIPQGLDSDKKHRCLKLKKAIYGLKQAPLAWYRRLSSWLLSIGFKISKSDACVFFSEGKDPIWLFLHVDDIGIFGKNLSNFKEKIEREFQTKILGKADLMLGIKITHDTNSITLSQSHYIDSLLDLYGMKNCKPVGTPLIPNSHLNSASQEERSAFEKLEVNYHSAVGSLSYVSSATRPDLSYPVSALSQFLEKPGIEHWNAFLHVLKYLKGTQDVGLTYTGNNSEAPVAYSDADWGNCRLTRRSVTGYLVKIFNNLVVWKTRKQPTVSLSSAEAKYKSLTDLGSELIWFKQFCREVNIFDENNAIIVHEDNQGCIDTSNSDSNTNARRMKHIDIQLHFIREMIEDKKIKLVYTPSSNMLADFLTKSVSRPALKRALQSLKLFTYEDRGGVEGKMSQSVS
ncbi:hypothetical protein O181_097921 [Austropuccinia psidii MF-1]|uniref:Integrase catalytic domain-containing protein n=1 Tax=Austropuccinia psidii MF-1 TaxID=1389203 RepID=A0A9Q3J9W5_9BASI|nr:hypothetical protein [Austropuccinia psidii MF-1]